MTEREALKLALEALDLSHPRFGIGTAIYIKAIAAIKEALTQPEQEPVAWMFQHEETGRMMFVEAQQLEWGFEKGNPRLKKIRPVYTTPPQRKPLSDEEFRAILRSLSRQQGWDGDGWDLALKEAIEAAHGIKGEA